MEWLPLSTEWNVRRPSGTRRWVTHEGHGAVAAPHRLPRVEPREWDDEESWSVSSRLLTLDGSKGEGGGQILRTALTLSLLTGKPFRIVKIRANREKPGLRPQHLKTVEAAADLASAVVVGGAVGSRDLTFRPSAYTPRDLSIEIGTAGSTSLVLQTLHLPLALRAEQPVRVTLGGGTFNPMAPAFSFLDSTWRAYLAALGMPVALAMSSAGFYPKGGGLLSAWIEPATPRAGSWTGRGPLTRIRGVAGVANLRPGIAERMRDRALARLAERGLTAEIDVVEWSSPGQGTAISLIAEHEGTVPATFTGLGERGKPAEIVADEAVEELAAFEDAEGGAVDPHSADQILLPLSLAEGPSEYTVTEVTEHLRTNAATIRAFLDRVIEIVEPDGNKPGRVVIS